jgi:hypothetical protein
MKNTKKLHKAAKTIQKFCNKRTECFDCPMLIDNRCRLDYPNRWNIKTMFQEGKR